jgi:hypothetical protein
MATEWLAHERLGRETSQYLWQHRVREQLHGATEEERLVRAVASYTPEPHRLSTHRTEDDTNWSAVCFALDTSSPPSWDSAQLYDWFRRHAALPPPTRVQAQHKGLLGPKCVKRDAWLFTSSKMRRLKESGWVHDSIGLLEDGLLLLLRGDSIGPWVDMPEPASPLGPHGLKQMAALLDLPLLEPVPRSAHPLPAPRRS